MQIFTSFGCAMNRKQARRYGSASLALLALGITSVAGYAAAEEAAAPGPMVAPAPSSDRFVLTAVTVDGVTAYPQRELAPLYDQHLVREVGMEDLVRIATAITDKYRADGYFLTRAVVPPQAPGVGTARLRVYEGYIGEVVVTGGAARAVQPMLADLEGRRPLRLADLDRRLALASDLLGVRIRSRLEPDLDDPARHRLVVETELDRLDLSIYADNRGTESTGPWQAYARTAANTALRPGDQLSLSVLTTPLDPSEFTQVELAYSLPLPGGGRLRASASASSSDDSANASNTWLGNESRFAALRATYPVLRGRDHGLWASAGLDVRHVELNWLGAGRFKEDLSVVRVGAHGEVRGAGGVSTGFAQLSAGLDAFGATDRPTWRQSRWDADGQFFKINLQGTHYRDLGAYAGLYLAADAQWSPDPLLASEEFTAGGLPYGRAYNYGEISGDRGVAGLVELRLGRTVDAGALTFVQTYGFVDAAKVWNDNAAPGRGSAALSSAGLGLRLRFDDRLVLRIEAARPLTRTPYTEGDKDVRGFAAISAAF
jgi:hemolysin activation/secretion protein